MEVFVAVSSCLMLGGAVFALASSLLEPARGRPSRKRGPKEALGALASWLELVGHVPFVVRLCNRAPVVPFSMRLRKVLAARGIALSRHACVALLGVAVVASMLLCLLISRSALGVPVGAALVSAATAALMGRHDRAVAETACEQMPEVLRSLSSALGAGRSLPQAIEYVGATVGEPVGAEFQRASLEIKGGKPVDRAIDDLCGRIDAPGVSVMGAALQISQRTGSSLTGLFSRTASMVAESAGLRRELQVMTSQVRLSAKVVAGIPVLLVCALTLLSPNYRDGLGTAAGRACLCLSALLDATALRLISRLMKRSLS